MEPLNDTSNPVLVIECTVAKIFSAVRLGFLIVTRIRGAIGIVNPVILRLVVLAGIDSDPRIPSEASAIK